MLVVVKWQTARWIAGLFLAVFLVLSAWTAYTNVFSDDTAVRVQAERLAREKAACGDKCTLIRTEGTRGVLNDTLSYTFRGAGPVIVTCRRPYIAFGDYLCDASKP